MSTRTKKKRVNWANKQGKHLTKTHRYRYNGQPILGCRPDSTNAACILGGMGAGAAFGGVPGACFGAACGLGAAVKRRFTGRGRKSRKKRGRKHKRKTRKHKKKHRRRKSTHKHKKKRKKRRTTKKR